MAYNRFSLLDYSISKIPSTGLVMEFGVYQGATINHIARRVPSRTVYGFDSFIGLPEDWKGGIKKGSFSTNGNPPQVMKNVRLVVGMFEKTLPEFITKHKDDVAFLHIDCDLYSSTSTVFRFLEGRIKSGTVIQFDEMVCYEGWERGEFLEILRNARKALQGWDVLLSNSVKVLLNLEFGEDLSAE